MWDTSGSVLIGWLPVDPASDWSRRWYCLPPPEAGGAKQTSKKHSLHHRHRRQLTSNKKWLILKVIRKLFFFLWMKIKNHLSLQQDWVWAIWISLWVFARAMLGWWILKLSWNLFKWTWRVHYAIYVNRIISVRIISVTLRLVFSVPISSLLWISMSVICV